MHKTSIQVRFRDTDGMGHVNNAVYLTYLESARMDFFAKHTTMDAIKDISFILAHVAIDFKLPITLKDSPEVVLWVESIGNTSWWFGYKIIDSNDPNKIFVDAKSVQVVYNYNDNKKEQVSENFKQILSKFKK